HHQLAVGAEVDITLQQLGAVVQGATEGGQGVLRADQGGAAVAHDGGTGSSVAGAGRGSGGLRGRVLRGRDGHVCSWEGSVDTWINGADRVTGGGIRSTQAVVWFTLAGRPVHGGAALGPAEREYREGDIMSTTSTSHPTTRTDPAPVPRPGRALRPRGGRRLLAPLAGMAFAAALVTGCGAEEPTDPEETTAQEEAPPGEDDTE